MNKFKIFLLISILISKCYINAVLDENLEAAINKDLEQSEPQEAPKLSPIEKALERMEEEFACFATFAFCDINGNLKEINVPIDQAKDILNDGLSVPEKNLLLKPELETLRFIPWTTEIHRAAWFMCNIYNSSLQPSAADPRSILAQLNKKINDLGYNFKVGIEFDFYLLEKNEQGFLIPSDEMNYLDAEHNLSKQQEINLLMHALEDFKVNIERLDHGPSNGQWRIILKENDALKMADNVIACKHALNVLTNRLKQHITFMPKPFDQSNGCKMRIRYTLFDTKKNKNAFYDKLGQYKLSKIARQFLAGNLDRSIELSAIFMPLVNSYKNICFTQRYNAWSETNHYTSFNSILSDKDEKLFLKFNVSDPTANIYLTLAALLKSGIQGINKSKVLNTSPYEPRENNALLKDKANSVNLKLWPNNLHEALNIFEKSEFSKSLMSDNGHKKFLEFKKKEWNEFNSFVTDWEIQKYI